MNRVSEDAWAKAGTMPWTAVPELCRCPAWLFVWYRLHPRRRRGERALSFYVHVGPYCDHSAHAVSWMYKS